MNIEEVEKVRAANKAFLESKGAELARIVEVHAAVCMIGSEGSIEDTRGRAIQAFTEMLIGTENACAQMLAIAKGEVQ